MRKQLYQAIIAQLKLIQVDNQGNYYTAIPVTEPVEVGGEVAIKHFDVWNKQLQYIADETPFPLPAVFLQFQPITWEQRSKGVRAADVKFTLHVVTRHQSSLPTRLPSPQGEGSGVRSLAFFDLLAAINANLYGLKADFFRNLISDTSDTDHDHDELIDSKETYTVQLTDKSAVKPVVKVTPAPKVNVELG